MNTPVRITSLCWQTIKKQTRLLCISSTHVTQTTKVSHSVLGSSIPEFNGWELSTLRMASSLSVSSAWLGWEVDPGLCQWIELTVAWELDGNTNLQAPHWDGPPLSQAPQEFMYTLNVKILGTAFPWSNGATENATNVSHFYLHDSRIWTHCLLFWDGHY